MQAVSWSPWCGPPILDSLDREISCSTLRASWSKKPRNSPWEGITMNEVRRYAGVVLGLLAAALPAHSSDLHIHLQGTAPLTSKVVSFSCDENAGKLNLPTGVFQVQYINGAGNSLAVLPIGGRSLVFSGVLSGSGSRYAADRYTWSDGGPRGAFLWSDSLAGHAQTLCQSVK